MDRPKLQAEALPEEEFPEEESGAEEVYLTVPPESVGERLDRYLAASLPDHSRSYIQKLIRDGQVRLDGKSARAGEKLKAGARLDVTLPEPEELAVLPEDLPLDILYEDADVILVNKPKGMVVHPAAGHSSGTLVNALLYHCRGGLSGINGVLRPGIVHRIDRDTTGVLIACKNDRAHQAIAAQLKEHSITRRYRALVFGNLKEDTGTVDAPLGRSTADRKKMAVVKSGGRRAVTHYQVLERFGAYTYIECRLETGRTHQIRVHMASIGHPLLGDTVYGRAPEKQPFALEGQALHAMTLGFRHPTSGEYLEFSAPLPEYFEALLTKLRKAQR